MFVPPNYISDTIHIVGSMYKLSIKAQRARMMEQGDKCIPDAPKQYKLNFKTLIYSFNTVDFR